MELDKRLSIRPRGCRVRRRRRPRPTSALPNHHRARPTLPHHSDRRPRLLGHRHDVWRARGLAAEFVGKGRHLHEARAETASGRARSKHDGLDARVLLTGHGPIRVAVVPTVAGQAVPGRHRPRADRRVTGTRHRIAIGVRRVPEHRPVIQQTPEAAGPLAAVEVNVARRELVQDHQDDKPWRGRLRPAALLALKRRRSGHGDGQQEGRSDHKSQSLLEHANHVDLTGSTRRRIAPV